MMYNRQKLYYISGTNEKDPLTNEPLYWSNEGGWVTENFTTFTEYEKKHYNLPINGKWVLFHFTK